MAVRRDTRYPGRWTPADADFPLGGPKDRTTSTAKDGSYFNRDFMADYEAFFQRAMSEAGLTANETPDTAPTSQFYEAFELVRPVENRIKGQQNWNIPNSTDDPLIDATPTTRPVGQKPAVNVKVVYSDAVNLRRTGGIVQADSGTLRIYARGAYRAGVIDETTEYMGITDHTGAQLEAGVATGVTKGNNGTDLYVDVDLSQFPNGFRFAGISAERGLWPEVSDDEAVISVFYGVNSPVGWKFASLNPGVEYTNPNPYPIEVAMVSQGSATTGEAMRGTLSIDTVGGAGGRAISRSSVSGASFSGAQYYTVSGKVPAGSTYTFSEDSTISVSSNFFILEI